MFCVLIVGCIKLISCDIEFFLMYSVWIIDGVVDDIFGTNSPELSCFNLSLNSFCG